MHDYPRWLGVPLTTYGCQNFGDNKKTTVNLAPRGCVARSCSQSALTLPALTHYCRRDFAHGIGAYHGLALLPGVLHTCAGKLIDIHIMLLLQEDLHKKMRVHMAYLFSGSQIERVIVNTWRIVKTCALDAHIEQKSAFANWCEITHIHHHCTDDHVIITISISYRRVIKIKAFTLAQVFVVWHMVFVIYMLYLITDVHIGTTLTILNGYVIIVLHEI